MPKDNTNEIIMDISHVSKDFYLPHHKTNSIKSAVVNIFKRKDKETDTQHTLKDISFSVKRGEFFGILGRNGSGKSTLLKIIAEIYKPTGGSVHTHGKLVPFIELGVGFNAELTGKENVYLNGALLGFSHKEMDERYDDIVAFAELEDFMDQKLKNYSSGMQVRLAFSVATNAEADILLIDEVLAVGDADFQRKCYDYFKSLKKFNKTVVFVSHDMSAVREFCDKAILIERSRIIAAGKADDIAMKYSRLFIDEAESSEDQKGLENIDGERFGNNSITIKDAKVRKQIITDEDKELIIELKVKAKETIEEPVVGFVINDGTGDPICGTNTQIKGIKAGILEKNQEKKYVWVVDNIFADGKYTITLAVHASNGATIYDWWVNALVFKVKKIEKTAYKITPPTRVTIT